jgi:hypothetical protein
MSNILSFSNWTSTNILNEDVKRAKKYLEELYKPADKTPISDQEEQSPIVSREDQEVDQSNMLIDTLPIEPEEAQNEQPDNVNRISKEEATELYDRIRELLKNNDGYVYAFLKFAIDHNIPMNAPEGKDSLNLLYSLIKKYASSLNQLPMSIEEYAMSDTIRGVDSFEALMDDFGKFETRKKYKWVIDGVNAPLRNSIRELSKTDPTLLDKLYTAAEQIDAYDEKNRPSPEIDPETGEPKIDSATGKPVALIDPVTGKQFIPQRARVLIKSNAFSDGLVYLKAVEDTAEGLSNPSVIKKIEEIEAVEPEAELIYSSDGYMVIAVRTEAAQKELFKLVATIWCLNYGRWYEYGGLPDRVQYNIYNFNLPTNDRMHLVGNTIDFTGTLKNCHDRNDDPILKSSNPKENLEKHGYPADLINAMVDSIDREKIIKPFVTNVGIDSANPSAGLTSIIRSSYNVNADSGFKGIMLKIINTQILGKLSEDQITEVYSKTGIFTPFSAMLFNTLMPNMTDSQKNQIIDRNNISINSLRKIVDHLGPEFNTRAASIVNDTEAIKEIIISGETITK